MGGVIVPRFHFDVIGFHRGQEFGCLFGILTADDGGYCGLIAHIVVGGGGGGGGRHRQGRLGLCGTEIDG